MTGILLCGVAAQGFAQDARPLGRELPTYKAGQELSSVPIPAGEITPDQAAAWALLHNPQLAAYSWEVRVREAERLQAGLRPNPEILLDVEDFAGTGAQSGFGGSQATVQIGQTLELGGKRAARVKAASLHQQQAGWEYEAARLEVLGNVSAAYAEVVAAQRNLKLAEESVGLAERSLNGLSLRSKAGRASTAEEARIKASATQTRIALAWAKHRLEEAREGLSALWGGTEPSFTEAQDSFDSLPTLPSYDLLLEDLKAHPRLASLNSARAAEEAQADAERAARIPGVTIRGGYRHLAATDDHAAVAGISVPLPLLNRNQGRILQTRHRVARIQREKEGVVVHLRGQLAEAYAVAQTAAAEISLLRTSVLPEAQSGYESVAQGYDLGRYGYLETLDAQQSLLAARTQYVRALLEHHQAIAKLEALTGRPLRTPSTERNSP